MELKKSRELRRLAWEKLMGCWGECVSIILVEAGIIAVLILSALMVMKFCNVYGMIDFDIDTFWKEGTFGFWIAAVIIASGATLMLSPIRFGVSWFFLQTAKGRSVPASAFFNCYINKTIFTKILKLHAAVSLRKLVIILPAIVLCAVELLLANGALKDAKDSFIYTAVLCCLILLMAGMLFMYLFVSLRYTLVPLVLAENPEKPIEAIIKESKQCVCGNESYILEILFSAGPWIASGILIFPLVVVLPYIQMTFTLAAKELMDYNAYDSGADSRGSLSYKRKKEESTFV